MKKFFLFFYVALLPMVVSADDSGTCGDNLSWTYVEATKTLTISGKGEMSNYYHMNGNNTSVSPWKKYKIKTAIIEDGVTSIGSCAFYECGLSSISIPSSVMSIGDRAFYACGFKSLNLPNGLKTIYDQAFYCCQGLSTVIIPQSVISIGKEVFEQTYIKKIIWLTNTQPDGYGYAMREINYVSNDLYGNTDKTIIYPNLSSLFEVDGIIYVPVSPSERTCDAIDCIYDTRTRNTTIPSTISYKGIDMKVQKIQPYTCYKNIFMESLECDNNGAIEKYAFAECSNLKNAQFGERIVSIGDNCFQNCQSLLEAKISNNVTTIGSSSFQGCTSLQDVTIGLNVNRIERQAFSGCSSLININIGPQVNIIEANVFQNCSSLPLLRIPNSVNSIGNGAFAGCIGLKTFIIDNRDEELKLGCNEYQSPLFTDCPLDSVYIGGNITYGTSEYYGYSPFYRNKTLRTVVITDKETEISTNEFYGCSNLQKFVVGEGVTTFGDWAFSGCLSLQTLSFGSQLNSIGKEAFSDCASVTKIVSRAKVPPTCDTQALDDINKWSCTLYVPIESKSSYQSAEQWKEFFFMEEGTGGEDNPVNPPTNKCEKPTIQYSNGKLTFNSDTDGATFLSTITDSDIASYSSKEIELGITYNISVYATKPGFENSEVVTATLCWIDVEPKTEGIGNGVAKVNANPVLIQANNGQVTIEGVDDGTIVSIYGVNGQQVGSAISNDANVCINTNLSSGSIAIIKIGEKSVKVIVR